MRVTNTATLSPPLLAAPTEPSPGDQADLRLGQIAARALLSLGDAPRAFGGLKIYPQANWPKVQDGTRQVRFPAHPLICWLARWLPMKPYIEATYPRYRDQDPLIMGDHVFCSFAQHEELRRAACVRG